MDMEVKFSNPPGRSEDLLDQGCFHYKGCDLDLGAHLIPVETAVVKWDVMGPFNRLTPRQKLYAHYLSKAAWYGCLIIPVQTSPESPVIFSLLHDLFRTNSIEGVKQIAKSCCNFSELDWRELLAYTCGIFSNCGNYLGFGDTKIIPALSVNKLSELLGHEKIRYSGEEPTKVKKKWEVVKRRIYSLGQRDRQLGLGKHGVTTYFSPNCTEEDGRLVSRFMKAYRLNPINTRVFKHFPNLRPSFPSKDKSTIPLLYEIRTACILGDYGFGCAPHFEFEKKEFILTSGDYAPQLKDVCFWLSLAKEFSGNEYEANMLDEYIKSFHTGAVDEHKEGTRHWLKNKAPPVETYMGFIETFRDPTDARAEFESVVLIPDPILTRKFNELADKADEFLALLPWPSEFEREHFVKPDFTAQEVLTYAASCVFDGVNVPNYPDIRSKEGYKNIALTKVSAALYGDSLTPFLSPEDAALHAKYFTRAHDIQLGLHELLGHGCGKLLVRNDDGTTNFPSELLNPLTGTFIDSVYETGETYDSLFPAFGSSMEECRAECVALYLSLEDEVLKVFGYEGAEAEDIKYVNWLDCVYSGTALCLKAFNPKIKQWKQSLDQAKFGILRVLIDAGQGLVSISECVDSDGKPDLKLSLDRSKVSTVGRDAIGDFLLKLQIHKATANVQEAQRLYLKATTVTNEGIHPWLQWREIMLLKEQPQRLCVQPNTFLTDNGTKVELVTYEPTFEGFIQSWLDRYDDNEGDDEPSLYEQLDYCWQKDKAHF